MPPYSFPKTRLTIEAGYSYHPFVYDELDFHIPAPHRSTRCVRTPDGYFELWSPNSEMRQLYPGYGPLLPACHTNDTIQFYDGHMGPRDWSLYLQHFHSTLPWIGFCRLPPLDIKKYQYCWYNLDAEFIPAPYIWIPKQGDTGSLNSMFTQRLRQRVQTLFDAVYAYPLQPYCTPRDHAVWLTRPVYPSVTDIDQLASRTVWLWAELVDTLTAIQRGMREMEAWLTMMTCWDSCRDKHLVHLQANIPVVKVNRVGVWLNGASESDAAWLLNVGVIPVYVIHRFVEGHDFPGSLGSNVWDRRPEKTIPDFWHCTPAEKWRSPSHNPYLQVLQQSTPAIPIDKLHLLRGIRRSSTTHNSVRSSSWAYRVYQRQLNSQSTGSSSAAAPHLESSSSSMQDGQRAMGSNHVNSGWGVQMSSNDGAEHSWGSGAGGWEGQELPPLEPQDTRSPRFVFPPPKPSGPPEPGRLITEGQTSFWIPPAIVNTWKNTLKVCPNTPWTVYREVSQSSEHFPDSCSGKTAMVLMSKSKLKAANDRGNLSDTDDEADVEEGSVPRREKSVYWDRWRLRKLEFRHPLPIDKRVCYPDSRAFGFPLPEMEYYNLNDHSYKKTVPSIWAYDDSHPLRKDDVGRTLSIEECRPRTTFPSASLPSSHETLVSREVFHASLQMPPAQQSSTSSSNNLVPSPPSSVPETVLGKRPRSPRLLLTHKRQQEAGAFDFYPSGMIAPPTSQGQDPMDVDGPPTDTDEDQVSIDDPETEQWFRCLPSIQTRVWAAMDGDTQSVSGSALSVEGYDDTPRADQADQASASMSSSPPPPPLSPSLPLGSLLPSLVEVSPPLPAPAPAPAPPEPALEPASALPEPVPVPVPISTSVLQASANLPPSSSISRRRRCAGARESLFVKFGIGFWELMELATVDTFLQFTPSELDYTISKLAERSRTLPSEVLMALGRM
ncbi:hypothetical protein AX16_002000 [Volvariella volvacea WC 439]|nr:hypothetical protein AX16_002000 [Volvariella volvacea WC 439]